MQIKKDIRMAYFGAGGNGKENVGNHWTRLSLLITPLTTDPMLRFLCRNILLHYYYLLNLGFRQTSLNYFRINCISMIMFHYIF